MQRLVMLSLSTFGPYIGRNPCSGARTRSSAEECSHMGKHNEQTSAQEHRGRGFDWDKDDHSPVESQFKEAALVIEVDRKDAMEESTAEALPVQNISEASVGPGSQDMVQIHTGDDDLD